MTTMLTYIVILAISLFEISSHADDFVDLACEKQVKASVHADWDVKPGQRLVTCQRYMAMRGYKKREYAKIDSADTWVNAFEKDIESGSREGVEILLDIAFSRNISVDLNKRLTNGATYLQHAASSRKPALVHALLKAKADPNLADESGNTALHYAARTGDVDSIVALLADSRIDAGKKNTLHTPAIAEAVASGCQKCAQTFQKNGVKFPDEIGKKYFSNWVIKQNTIAALNAWIPAKKDRTAWRNEDRDALDHVAARGGSDRILRYLQTDGFDLLAPNKKKESAASILLRNGKVELYLDLARTNTKLAKYVELDGTNLIHWAIKNESQELFDFAMKSKANPDLLSAWQGTPLHQIEKQRQIAEKDTELNPVKKQQRLDLLSRFEVALIKSGAKRLADVRGVISEKELNELYSELKSKDGKVKARADWGSIAHFKTNEGRTLLELAVMKSDLDLLEKLSQDPQIASFQAAGKLFATFKSNPKLLESKRWKHLYERLRPRFLTLFNEALTLCKPDTVKAFESTEFYDSQKVLLAGVKQCNTSSAFVENAFQNGASLLVQDNDGSTAIHLMTYQHQPALIWKTVLQHPDAKKAMSLRNKADCTPFMLYMAELDGCNDTIFGRGLVQLEAIEEMLAAGADPNEYSGTLTPLMRVADYGAFLEKDGQYYNATEFAIEALLKHGGAADAVTSDGLSVLMTNLFSGFGAVYDNCAPPIETSLMVGFDKERYDECKLFEKRIIKLARLGGAYPQFRGKVSTLGIRPSEKPWLNEIPKSAANNILHGHAIGILEREVAKLCSASKTPRELYYLTERHNADAMLDLAESSLKESWKRISRDYGMSYRRMKTVLGNGKVTADVFRPRVFNDAMSDFETIALGQTEKMPKHAACGYRREDAYVIYNGNPDKTPFETASIVSDIPGHQWACQHAMAKSINAASYRLRIDVGAFDSTDTLRAKPLRKGQQVRALVNSKKTTEVILRAGLGDNANSESMSFAMELNLLNDESFEKQVARSRQKALEAMNVRSFEQFNASLDRTCKNSREDISSQANGRNTKLVPARSFSWRSKPAPISTPARAQKAN